MTIFIPPRDSKQVNQNNRSKILGNVWSTMGLDLQSNLGVIKLANRLMVNTASVANQGLSVAFKTFDQIVFTIAGTRIFKNSAFNLVSTFTEDASAGAITTYDPLYSDMAVFNSVLCTSAVTKLMSKATDVSGTGAWTLRYTLTTATSLHKLLTFKKFSTDRLYFIDDFNTIKSSDTSWSIATSGNYFISLSYVTGLPYTMEEDGQNIWIGTVNQTPSGVLDAVKSAYILVWDGISAQITKSYRVKAQGILALCKDDNNVMHAIDSNGALLRFSGYGFSEIGRLPLNKEMLTNALTGLYNSFIHPNGFYFTKNGTFIVLINNAVGDNGVTIKENIPSGVWEYSKETGFVHRQSITYTPITTTTITDFGQNRVSAVGALIEPNIYSSSSSGKPTLICGATYYTNASSTASGILVDDPLDTTQKYGYFVTPWIQSQGIKDMWQKAVVRYRQFLNSADKIVLKYRTTESASTEISIIWVSTTSFTTTTNVLAYTGYEVEVIQGTGSGLCSHITLISNNAGTYTVTVDETYTGVTTGTAKARLQNWIKISSVSNQTTESNVMQIGRSSERIQVKCCMQFTGEDELQELVILNKEQEKMV